MNAAPDLVAAAGAVKLAEGVIGTRPLDTSARPEASSNGSPKNQGIGYEFAARRGP